MKEVLEVTFRGWTATPRLPFVLSGNAVCMKVPSYSVLLGVIGCCLGRLVTTDEVNFAVRYEFEEENKDMETRQRLESDGDRIKPNSKGNDVHMREYHSNPRLTLWIDRLDWEMYFVNPVGTPVLGRSQDLLWITGVRKVCIRSVQEGIIAGCMIPFVLDNSVAGQIVQLAEAFVEAENIGGGRLPVRSAMYIAVPHDSPGKVAMSGLYETGEGECIYLHEWRS